ncbi:ferrochelatase [Porphyromonas circumdentaria]|uniref:coproporphyrin ferrochelatase n=1 Tax=Porphyromonas circumdentaria TaxID=29524 RepID=A0A1T4P2B0_9PORP|nr:ferrochelatase [Porphyromonas circumdentaria]MBB6276261.1 ferrochelatase [Porphyromonas circumdentaria]SJZ85058.1 ferrochelatase [Porphyromonas circumdentaria]
MNILILCTIGTPQDTSRQSIKKYLQSFLGDKNIVSVPQPFRYLLTRGIIIPSKLDDSLARYQKLASLCQGDLPLRRHLKELKEGMQKETQHWRVLSFMQYCGEKPSSLIKEIERERKVEQIVLLPIFAHETFSSYYASFANLPQLLSKKYPNTPIRIVPPYYQHPTYIRLLQESIAPYTKPLSDLYIASFHSIPITHWKRGIRKGFDYKEQCEKTAQLLFAGLPEKSHKEMLFQSSIKPHRWLNPIIEKEMYRWVKRGYKRVTVVCPGFAVDCLETILDIGEELRSNYLAIGGEELRLVPCLNSGKRARELYFQLAEGTLLS